MSARDCLRTPRLAGVCPMCGLVITGPAHLPLDRVAPATCGACCSNCNELKDNGLPLECGYPDTPDEQREPSQASTGRAGNISGALTGKPLASDA